MDPGGPVTLFVLRPLSDLFPWAWRIERRIEFLYRRQFDRWLWKALGVGVNPREVPNRSDAEERPVERGLPVEAVAAEHRVGSAGAQAGGPPRSAAGRARLVAGPAGHSLHRRHAPRAEPQPAGPVDQSGQPLCPPAGQPLVAGGPRHPAFRQRGPPAAVAAPHGRPADGRARSMGHQRASPRRSVRHQHPDHRSEVSPSDEIATPSTTLVALHRGTTPRAGSEDHNGQVEGATRFENASVVPGVPVECQWPVVGTGGVSPGPRPGRLDAGGTGRLLASSSGEGPREQMSGPVAPRRGENLCDAEQPTHRPDGTSAPELRRSGPDARPPGQDHSPPGWPTRHWAAPCCNSSTTPCSGSPRSYGGNPSSTGFRARPEAA